MINDLFADKRQTRPAPRTPVFRVRPPSEGNLLPTQPVAIGQAGSGVDVQWLADQPRPANLKAADSVVGNALLRARRAVSRHEDSARAHTNLAQALWHAGQIEDAARHCAVALEHDPENYPARLLLARICETRGDLDAAVRHYERARSQRPKETVPLVGLATAAIRRGEFDSAQKLLRDVIELDPTAGIPRLQLGMVLLRLGRKDEAIGQLKKATRIDVRSPIFHYALGLAYWATGAFRRAEQAFRSALHLAPSYAAAARSFGHLLIVQKQLDKATRYLEDWLRQYDDNAPVRELLGMALLEQGGYRRAAGELKSALQAIEEQGRESKPRARIANNIAVCYSRLRDWKSAEMWYERALALEPQYTAARHNFARVCLDTDRPRRALALLEDVPGEAGIRDAETEFLIAIALHNGSRNEDAVAVLARLVEREDAPVDAFAFLGVLLVDEFDKASEAVTVLEEGRRRFPTNVLVTNDLAYALLLADRVAEARAILEQYPEGAVDDVYLRATWGLLHLREGDFAAGVDGYERAQALATARGDAVLARQARQRMRLELARYYFDRKDRQAAGREITAGLEIGGKYRRQLDQLKRVLEA